MDDKKDIFYDLLALLVGMFVVTMLTWSGSYALVAGNSVVGWVSIVLGLIIGVLMFMFSLALRQVNPHFYRSHWHTEYSEYDGEGKTLIVNARGRGVFTALLICLVSYFFSKANPVSEFPLLNGVLLFVSVIAVIALVWLLIHVLAKKPLRTTHIKL